jgi:ankyrin repeat protein
MDQDLQVLGNQLLIAAQNGNNETTKALLTQGAPVDAKDNAGWTPLMLASANNHVAVCVLLLTHKAHVDAKNNDGYTPLMLAIMYGHEDLYELLIAHGAQINARNNFGWTPLMCAAWNDYADVCKWLIDAMIRKEYEFTKNKQAIIIVLGMRKKNECLGLRLIGHDMVLCIARMVFNMAKQDNVNAVEQINAIRNNALKTELLNYYQTQLSALQGAQPKDCHE